MMGKFLGAATLSVGVIALFVAVFGTVEPAGTAGGLVPSVPSPAMAATLSEAEVLPIKDVTSEYYDLSFKVQLGGTAPLVLSTGYPAGVYVAIHKDKSALGFLSGGTFLERVRSNLRNSAEHSVLVRRRGAFYDLVVDDVMTGGVTFACAGESLFRAAGNGVKVTDVRFQSIREPVVFGDDFMRETREGSPWQSISGKWETVGINSPTLSANPFRLSAVGARAISVAGKPFWDAYRASVSALGEPGQKMGVVFSCRDENNYHLFRWSARSDTDAGKAELVLVRDGGYSTIAEKVGGYMPGVWYKMEVVAGMGWARLYVDEVMMFEVVRPTITGGRFGLYADGVNRTYFDDVVIGPYQEAAYNGAGWFRYFRPLSGRWEEGSEALRCDVGGAGGFPALYACAVDWREWCVEAEVKGGNDCGVAAATADPMNFIALAVRGRDLVLLQRSAGREEVLASAALPAEAGPVRLNLTTSRFIAKGTARKPSGGAVTISAPLPQGLNGGAGLVAFSGRAEFAPPLAVSVPRRSEAILTGNATFSSESSMATWAGEMSDWYKGQGNSYWYRGFFPGDVEVCAELADARMPVLSLLALGIKKTGEEGAPMNGYVFTVRPVEARALDGEGQPGDASGIGLNLVLSREGKEVAARTLRADALYAAGLRAVGETVAGYINGMPAVSYRDPGASEMVGYKAAYLAEGFALQPGNVLVTTNRMHDYQFSTAPTDWRVAAGVWEVTNRWQCDPRWSFFSGSRDGRNKLVMLWNKRQFRDPIRIEFYAGIKMEKERGNRYEYARDLNVSLSPDGVDTTTGYTFMFGGFNNEKSAILRKGEVAAATTQGLIDRSMRIHRHWYHVVVEKDGKKLAFKVDDNYVKLTYDDPEPIDAGRVAIWSYDCSIMVSRVRISGGGGEIAEMPGFSPGRLPQTVYDVQGQAGPGEGRK